MKHPSPSHRGTHRGLSKPRRVATAVAPLAAAALIGTGVLTFAQAAVAAGTLVAHDDTWIGESSWPVVFGDVLANDDLGDAEARKTSAARVTSATLKSYEARNLITGEVVSMPTPTVSVDDIEHADNGPHQNVRTDFHAWDPGPGSFERIAVIEYTITDGPATSTATLTVGQRITQNGAAQSRMYWKGGPKTFTMDAREISEQALGVTLPTDATVKATFAARPVGTLTPGAGDTITHSFATWPTTGVTTADDRTDQIQFTWKTSGGKTLATVAQSLIFRDPVLVEAKDDGEYWVAVGDSVSIPLVANDDFGNDTSWLVVARPIGGDFDPRLSGYSGGPRMTRFEGEEHGSFFSVNGSAIAHRNADGSLVTPWGEPQMQADRDTEKWDYLAASPGTDVITYSLCAAYPAPMCTSAKVTIHVLPKVVANPDEATTEPGVPVTVPVLDNDVVQDDPDRSTVEVTSLPDGVEATVNPDRTVTVTAPAEWAGRTVEGEYRLANSTSASEAEFRVRVAGVPTENSTPTDTPTGEPQVDPTPSDDPTPTGQPTGEPISDPEQPTPRIDAGGTHAPGDDETTPVAAVTGAGLLAALASGGLVMGLWRRRRA